MDLRGGSERARRDLRSVSQPEERDQRVSDAVMGTEVPETRTRGTQSSVCCWRTPLLAEL